MFVKMFQRRLAHNLLAVSAILAVGIIGVSTETKDSVVRPDVVDGPTALMEQHGCWEGSAPKDMEGKMPGHVVVTKGATTRYAGEAMVGKALDQIFNGVDHGLTVHGFCR